MFGSGLLQRPLSIRETARRFPRQPGIGSLLEVAPTAATRTTGKYYSLPLTAIGLTQPRGSQTMVFDSFARPSERESIDCQFRSCHRINRSERESILREFRPFWFSTQSEVPTFPSRCW